MNQQNKYPLVSIITPSYNQGRFIEETIQSVLGQGYPNIEYIVIDGGSKDNTVEILKKYEGRVKWISERDKGQSDAIDKGFKMSQGEILAWLNSDDTYLPDAINKIMERFNSSSDTGMVYGNSHLTDETGNIIGNYPAEPFNYNRLARSNFIAQPSSFFRREAYFAVGGIDEALHYVMDYDLWLRITKKYKAEYLPDFLSTFRLHAESKSVSENHALKAHDECLKTVMKYYKWVPPNRVYGYYYYSLRNKMPAYLKKMKPLIIVLSIFVSAVEYIRLNKGIKLDDIKMLGPHNIRKLFRGWEFKDLLK